MASTLPQSKLKLIYSSRICLQLCMHLDSEKLPRGFADKLYHEEGKKKSFLRRVVMFYLIKSYLLTFELIFLAKTIEMKISVHASQPNAGHTPTLPDIAIEQPRPHTPPAREPSPPPAKALKDDTQKAWILQAALAVSLSFKLIVMASVGGLVSYCLLQKIFEPNRSTRNYYTSFRRTQRTKPRILTSAMSTTRCPSQN